MKLKKELKVIFLNITIVAFSLSLFGCGEVEAGKENYIMGTIVNLKAYGSKKSTRDALEAATTRLSEIENKMSVNKSDSEVSKINNNAGFKHQKVSEDIYYVLNKAMEYAKLSKGNFDITVEPLVKLWGIGTKNAHVPSLNEIERAKALINYKYLNIKSKKEAYLEKKDMAIDLGGIAKGYAADEIKTIFKEKGIKSAFINIGGNVNLLGKKTDGTPWKIGIQNPLKDKGEYMGVLTLEDKSIVTSGNYERYFIENGKRYHHIFDVKTGYPSENGIISATIVSEKSIDGDALSTTTYVLGVADAMNLIESIKGVEGVFITKDKKVYITSGLKESFELTDKTFTSKNIN
ncbi:FAD:protein FMN transferase [Haloimpatiens sp. FM7315]|uniref:FAD:protein FMN transferase n=1 Tax=Haloimpatiens sp. FM7315 TaxID=3298609 RepID=UPI003977DD6E